jgi:hypothetical protein
MLLNNSKYYIRKSALVVNRSVVNLFPKNAYYNLKDIVDDLGVGGFKTSTVKALTAETVTVENNAEAKFLLSGNGRFTVDGQGTINLIRKLTTTKYTQILVSQLNTGLPGIAISVGDTASPLRVRRTSVVDEGSSMVFSNDISADYNMVSANLGGAQLSYIDTATSANNVVLTVNNNGVSIKSIPEHADNAAALADGMSLGFLYHTAGTLKIVV